MQGIPVTAALQEIRFHLCRYMYVPYLFVKIMVQACIYD